jgi:hypothetical protein
VPPEILVVVRASPLPQRSIELLRTIGAHGLPGAVKTVIVHPGHDGVLGACDFRLPEAEEHPSKPPWERQALELVRDSGCRWVTFPSSVDRYLPDGFRSVLAAPASRLSVIGRCRFEWKGRLVEPGPRDLPLSYFAWLTGFNHVAPGAAFLDARSFVDTGGFDARYPHAAHLEYLLRMSPRSRLVMLEAAVVETQASPFPGVPSESATAYALEAAAITLRHYPSVLTPGAMLGLAAVMAEQMRRFVGWDYYYDEGLARSLASDGVDWAHRYVRGLDAAPPDVEAPPPPEVPTEPAATVERELAPSPLGLRVRLFWKRVLPTRVWNSLRRSRRAWLAFQEPLP